MRRWWLAIACLMVVACSDDGSGPEEVQIPGTYSLQTINGQALPYTLFEFPGFLIITQIAGSVRLNPDRTYREENRLRDVFNDETGQPVVTDTTVVFTGTYESQDSAVLLTSNPRGLVSFGFVSGNRLTLSFESGDSLFTFIYLRN